MRIEPIWRALCGASVRNAIGIGFRPRHLRCGLCACVEPAVEREARNDGPDDLGRTSIPISRNDQLVRQTIEDVEGSGTPIRE